MRQIENDARSQWDEISKGKKYAGDQDDCNPSMMKGWTDNDPSLWEIIDHPQKPSRQEILAALCRNKKDDWEKITYLTFDKQVIDDTGLQIIASTGKTGDQKVDQSKTHYEIKGISVKRLCALLYNIALSQFVVGVFKRSEFLEIILKGYDKSRLMIVSKTDSMSVDPYPIAAVNETGLKNETSKREAEKVFLPLSSQTTEPYKSPRSPDSSTKS